MPNIFEKEIEVTSEHIDVNGHVNNVVYVQWMQEVAYAHSVANGYDAQKFEELGSTWVIRSHFVKYHRPALAGTKIVAVTWCGITKKASSLRKYKFVRKSDGATLASGESDWVYIDRSTGKPRPIEEEMLLAFPEISEDQEP